MREKEVTLIPHLAPQVKLKRPEQCVLWKHPEDLDIGQFDRIATYEEEGHFMRRLLKCKECGQLYFYEFYEEVDYSGNDPQYRTYLPVSSEAEIERLKNSSIFDLLRFKPRLQSDFLRDAKGPSAPRWR